MKKIFSILLLSGLAVAACTKKSDPLVSASTVKFQYYLGNGFIQTDTAELKYANSKILAYNLRNGDTVNYVYLEVNAFAKGTYYISDTSNVKNTAYYFQKFSSIGKDTTSIYPGYRAKTGKIVISEYDSNNNIASGTFEFEGYSDSLKSKLSIMKGEFNKIK